MVCNFKLKGKRNHTNERTYVKSTLEMVSFEKAVIKTILSVTMYVADNT